MTEQTSAPDDFFTGVERELRTRHDDRLANALRSAVPVGRPFIREREQLRIAVRRLAEAFAQPLSEQALEDVRIAAGMVESRAGDVYEKAGKEIRNFEDEEAI